MAVGECERLKCCSANTNCNVYRSDDNNLACHVNEIKADKTIDLLDSTGVKRADSFMKLSRSGRPLPVRSNSGYCAFSSSRSGTIYSG